MASRDTHRVNRLVEKLTQRMEQMETLIGDFMAPPGEAPALRTQLARREALAWWLKNYDNEFGQRIRKTMSPMQQLELDQALSEAIAQGQPLEVE